MWGCEKEEDRDILGRSFSLRVFILNEVVRVFVIRVGQEFGEWFIGRMLGSGIYIWKKNVFSMEKNFI